MKMIDLNGTWRLRWTDGQRGRAHYADREVTDEARYIDATVPGEVHLDLMKQGLIDDPYVGMNCLKARWVEECMWSYRRFFDVPADATSGRAWLVFEGLDYAAKIVLNGQEIAQHKNFFTPCRVEVTGKLKEGKNLLSVHLDPGLWEVAEKPTVGWHNHVDQILHKRQWLRKPQCQFSWDWSTRLINCGIHKPVRLEYTADVARADQFVPLVELSADLKHGTVRARWFIEGLRPDAAGLTLAAEVVEAGVKGSADIQVKSGTHPYEVKLDVANPRLWWPIGHGEPNLYTLKVTLKSGNTVVAEKSVRIGFRRVVVNQDKHPVSGRYFILEINNRRIFTKGGNFVPADMIYATLDASRYEKLVDLAIENNFNFLRIWGGGLYESDEFYEYCDRKGIMVWQEFIYACSKYPTTDQAFYENAWDEAIHQVRRLAKHASLVVWCGNNEIEVFEWGAGYTKGVVNPDHAFFHIALPKIMAAEDPTRFYQPSSPYSPDFKPPGAGDLGDQHPWSLGFGDTDFRKYRSMICRFPDEGGFLGPAALPTVMACLPEGQRKVQSLAWQVHDNSVDSWSEPSFPDQMLDQWLGRNIREMSIEDYVYYGGLVQGEALREYCDNFRRRMWDCAAAVFWMYNDTWPVVRSWTTVDYYLRRTPAFHPVRRAMAPINVVVVEDTEQVVVYGVNDTPADWNGELRYGLFELAGKYLVDQSAKVALAANNSTKLASFPKAQWKDPASSLAFAILSREGQTIARNKLVLPYFKELKWTKANVTVKLESGRAVFTSPTYAWGVCLDLDGETPLADNFFDVYPGIAYSIPWTGSQPPKVIRVGNL